VEANKAETLVRAQQGFRAFTADGEAFLLEKVQQRPDLAEKLMPILGEMGSRKAVDVLVAEIRKRETRIRRQRYFWRWVGLAIVAYSVNRWGWTGLFSLFLVGGLIFGEWYRSFRSSAAGALETIRDPRAVGALAVAHRDKQVRHATRPALLTLLPLVREEHAGDILTAERKAMQELVARRDIEVADAAISALTYVGNEGTVAFLRNLRGLRVTEHIQQKASAAADALVGRLETRGHRSSLLRAVASQEADPALLLRSAGEAATEPSLLLRQPLAAEGPAPSGPSSNSL